MKVATRQVEFMAEQLNTLFMVPSYMRVTMATLCKTVSFASYVLATRRNESLVCDKSETLDLQKI